MLAANEFGDYGYWLPPLISEHGHRVDNLINAIHVFMALLFVGWGVFFVLSLVKFRRREGAAASYELIKAKPSKYVEVAVIVIELVLLFVFSMPVWADYKHEPPAPDDRMELRAIGEQFQWDFHYPGADGIFGRTDAKFISGTNPIGLDEDDPAAKDDIQTINELHIPVGKPIYVRITSKDVIHSFSIPAVRVKQDAIPGMEIPIWFQIKEGATTENLKRLMTKEYSTGRADWYRLRHYVATKDYRDKSGQVALAAGAGLGATRIEGEKTLQRLREAGVESIEMQPANPLEVVCAQLCGNSHYTMKAQVYTYAEGGFEKWMDEKKKSETIEFDEF